MRQKLIFVSCALTLLFTWVDGVSAQSLSNSPSTKSTGSAVASTASPAATNAATPVAAPKALPVTPPISTTAANSTDSATMPASDFLINGVPYAKVLYLEGNVWIRPSGDTTFHLLAEDEPIAAQSIIHTGFAGVLDFATGPGMAVRMVPVTTVRVDELPQPAAVSAPTAANPEASTVAVKKGTIFSALGREDGQPIDFQVRTPQGVAGARGTMFATTVTDEQAQVSMLHGTVNFETPDHQASQIVAGQSQQISGSPGGKYQMGQRQAFSPAQSTDFFNHAGGLIEHASGYGVVRRGLGPDVARTLHEHGYALPAATQKRFQNASQLHYPHRPVFNHAQGAHAAGTNGKAGASTTPVPHPSTSSSTPTRRLTPQEEREREREQQAEKERANRRQSDEDGMGRMNKNGGQ